MLLIVYKALVRRFLYAEMPVDERFEFFATKYNLPENIAKDVAEARKLMDDLSYKIIGSKGFRS